MRLILLDTGNFHYCINRKYEGRRIDYSRLKKEWCEPDDEVIAYGAIPTEEAFTFRDALRNYGYRVKFRALGKGMKFYNPVIDIVLESVNRSQKVNSIVIGTSNQELIPIVTWLKARSIVVGIWGCGINFELQKIADYYREIKEEIFLEPVKADD